MVFTQVLSLFFFLFSVAMVTWEQLEYRVVESAGYASVCAIVRGEVDFAITAQVHILRPTDAGGYMRHVA